MSAYKAQVGDRVRVTFEGVIDSCFGGIHILVKDGDRGFWGSGSTEDENVISVEPV